MFAMSVTRLAIQQYPKFTVLVIMLCPILLLLSHWQLQRGIEKRALILAAQQHQSSVVSLKESTSAAFQKVRFKGQYIDKNIIWLDNRTRNARQGLEALVAVATLDAGIWIVNLGFVPWRAGEPLPSLSLSNTNSFYGQVAPLDSNPVLGESIEGQRIQSRKISVLDRVTDVDVKGEIRISPEHIDAQYAHWKTVQKGPETHFGYALQWLLMALVLVGLYLRFLFKEHNNNKIGEDYAELR